ncbi:MAG: Ig-like domain-containing protein [Candidatus Tectimicrobiota bacterium]
MNMCQQRMTVMICWSLLLLVLSTWGVQSVQAQGQIVQIGFEPASVTVPVDGRRIVRVVAQNVPAPGLAAFQFTLRFDPAPLDIVNPNEDVRADGIASFSPLSGILCRIVRNAPACPDPAWFLTSTGRSPQGQDTIDNATGRVQVVYGTSGQQAPPTGSGTLALIEIVGMANGTTSVNLTDVILAGNQAVPVPFAFVAGSLQVVVGDGGVQPNSAPVAGGQTVTTPEDTALPIILTGSDAETASVNLTFALATPPAHGSLSGELPNVTYTPSANYHGPDSFAFTVTDRGRPDACGTPGGSCTAPLTSEPATVNITVTPVNDAPVAIAGTVTTLEDTSVPIVLTGGDVETGAASLLFALGTLPAHGSLSGTPPNVTYTPDANYAGPDSFTFLVTDRGDPDGCATPGPACTAALSSAAATVSLTVSPVNDLPSAVHTSVSTREDTAIGLTLTATDPDSDDVLTFVIMQGPAHGSLSGTPPNVTYTPVANYHGADSFTFRANDGTSNSDLATVTITVTPVNDLPVAADQSMTTPEDTALALTLGATDVDTGDTLTFSIVQSPTHGTLTGTPPNVTYTPATDYHGADSFTFRTNDGTVDSNTATVSLTVTPVNDPPLAVAQSIPTLEDTAVAILLEGTDVDSGDTLTFAIVQGPSHGNLSGTPPNVTYTPATNYHGADSFTFRASDGTVDSDPASVSITVTAVNDAPQATAQAVTTPEDTALSITLGGTDVDAGDTLTFTIVQGPGHGTLSGTPPEVLYTPAADFHGADSFTFRANDGTVDSNTATISLTVTPVNDPPVLDPIGPQEVAEGDLLTLQVTASDLEQDALMLTVGNLPPGASFVDHGDGTGTFTWRPTAVQAGNYQVLFRVTDTGEPMASDVEDVLITVGNVNRRPVLAPIDAQRGQENQLLTFVLSATDPDEGDQLTFSTIDLPSGAVLDDHGNGSATFSWTPGFTQAGNYPVRFIVTDNGSPNESAFVDVMITIGDVNRPPVLDRIGNLTVDEGQVLLVPITSRDPDQHGLVLSHSTLPAFATFTDQGDGTGMLRLAPDQTAAGTYPDVVFTVTDSGTPPLSHNETLAIMVRAVNVAPVAIAQERSTDEDVAVAITLTATDVDGDALTFTIVGLPAQGTLSGTPPQLLYTPPANFHGTDSFTFSVDDGSEESAPATVSLTVRPVNDAPVAQHQSVATDENAVAITLGATDVDGDPVTFVLLQGPSHGTLRGTPPQVTYTPEASFQGLDSFTFMVNDGLLDSEVATVTITVTPGNRPPVAQDQSIATDEDVAVDILLSATDLDANVLTFAIVTAPVHGTLSGTPPNVRYTPAADVHGTDSFTFRANDGTLDSNNLGTVSLTVRPVNDAPVAASQSVSTPEDTALAIVLAATDVDGDTLTWTIMTAPTRGTLSGTPPTVLYTPAADFHGTDSLTFTAHDGTGDSSSATVSITVTPVNDAPVAASQTVSTSEDTLLAITLTATDVDNDTLTFTLVQQPAHGTLSGTPPQVTYMPAADFHGSDSFTFKANDGTVESNLATVSITVTPVNDPPVAASQTVSTSEDTPLAITLTATDVDGNQIVSFTLVQQPAHGTLSGAPPQVTYTPAADFHGADSFTFQASDGTVDSAVATVSITVTPVNDPPVLDPIGPQVVQEGQTLVVLLTATDPEGDACLMTAGNLPQGATFTDHHDCTATFSWTPGFDTAGNYRVLFTVTDTGTPMASDFEEVTITVGPFNRPPVLAPIGAQTAREGEPFSLELTATDPDVGDQLTFRVEGEPAGALFTDHGDGRATFSWLPDFTNAGTYPLRFTVTDNGSPVEQDFEDITLSVGNVNRPPVITPIGNQTVSAGQTLVLPVTASDPDGDTLTLTVANQPAFVTLADHGNGTGMLTLLPTPGDAGSYPDVTLTVTDNGTPRLMARTTFAITVQGLPPTAPEGLTGRAKLLSVNLVWSGSPGTTTFHVFRRLNTQTQFVALGQTGTHAFVDNLPQGTLSAEYFIVAENAFGMSPDSAIITVLPTTRR